MQGEATDSVATLAVSAQHYGSLAGTEAYTGAQTLNIVFTLPVGLNENLVSWKILIGRGFKQNVESGHESQDLCS